MPPRGPLALNLEAFGAAKEHLSACVALIKECHRRTHHPLWKYAPDRHPDADQFAFHSSPASVRLVFGGNQAGKSLCVAVEIVWWLLGCHPLQRTPQAPRIYVISAENRTIQEGVWKHFIRLCPRWELGGWGNKVPQWDFRSYYRMRNGARVDFISGEGREDARKKIQAAECQLIVIDEEVDGSLWKETQARRLHFGGRAIISATLIKSEPWVMELEEQAESGNPDVHLVRLSTYRAMARGHVDRKVLREIESTSSEEDREVRLEGKSRKRSGLVYPEFSRQHVVEPFAIPDTWTRYVCLDPGWRVFAAVYAAVAPDEKIVIYRAIYLHGAHLDTMVNAMLAAEGYARMPGAELWMEKADTEKFAARYIDPSAFGSHEGGRPKLGTWLAQVSSSLGVGSRLVCIPAPNDIDLGINLVRRALGHDLDGVPQLRVFRTCEDLIKEFRGYRFPRDSGHSQRNEPRDKPLKRNDHALDALRYLFLAGLTYQAPALVRLADDQGLPFLVSHATEERRKKHLERLGILKSGSGRRARVPHPGGIGDDY